MLLFLLTRACSSSQLTVAAPAADKRAVFHISDIRLGSGEANSSLVNARGQMKDFGVNVLGAVEHLDLRKVYDVEFVKSDLIKAHMQRDRVVVDFGHMTSAG